MTDEMSKEQEKEQKQPEERLDPVFKDIKTIKPIMWTKVIKSTFKSDILKMIRGGWSSAAISDWLNSRGEKISERSIRRFIQYCMPKEQVVQGKLLARVNEKREQLVLDVIQRKFNYLLILEDKLNDVLEIEKNLETKHTQSSLDIFREMNSLSTELIAIMRMEGYYDQAQKSEAAPGAPQLNVQFNTMQTEILGLLKAHPELVKMVATYQG
jgi:hypothetical protein